jgi:hypothetical protein
MPDVKIACPYCRQTLTNDALLSGQAVSCPHCQRRFQTPPAPAAVDLDLCVEQAASAPALAPRPFPAKKPAKPVARRRGHGAIVVALLSVVAVLLVIVAALLFIPRNAVRPPSAPDYESSARAALSAALDKWLTGDGNQAWHWDAIMAVLLDYEIHALRPVKTDLFDLPSEEWAKYEGPTAIYTDRPLTYLATVHATLKSRAGTPLPRVLHYRLTWLRDAKRWNIEAKETPG